MLLFVAQFKKNFVVAIFVLPGFLFVFFFNSLVCNFVCTVKWKNCLGQIPEIKQINQVKFYTSQCVHYMMYTQGLQCACGAASL